MARIHDQRQIALLWEIIIEGLERVVGEHPGLGEFQLDDLNRLGHGRDARHFAGRGTRQRDS